MITLVQTPESIQQTNAAWDRICSLVSGLPEQSAFLIAETVREGFRQNFLLESAGGEEPWAELAPMTQEERARLGYGAAHPILVRSRSLYYTLVDENDPLNLTEVDQGGGQLKIELGSRDPRFPLLHGGGINEGNFLVPARPMTVLGREGIALLRERIIYQLQKQLEED